MKRFVNLGLSRFFFARTRMAANKGLWLVIGAVASRLNPQLMARVLGQDRNKAGTKFIQMAPSPIMEQVLVWF